MLDKIYYIEDFQFVHIQEERKKFEKWAGENGFDTSRTRNHEYKSLKLDWMWKAWIESIISRCSVETVEKRFP